MSSLKSITSIAGGDFRALRVRLVYKQFAKQSEKQSARGAHEINTEPALI